MTAASRTRALAMAVTALSIVTIGLLIWLWFVSGSNSHKASQIAVNQGRLSSQHHQIEQLAREAKKARADREQLRRFAQALQHQIRRLGGTPLVLGPSSETAAEQQPPASGSSARPQPSSTPTPRPTPTPTPTPHQSPTPTPHPSPSICLLRHCV